MRRIVFFVLLAVTIVGCTQPGGGTQTPEAINICGYAQKGQLVKGSQVTAFALDQNMVATGSSYPANISDCLGSFTLDISAETPYLELRAEGYYFNEITGTVSESPIYLEAIAPAVSANVNINLFTTIIKPRVKHLISSGKSYSESVAQAQAELLSMMGVESGAVDFTDIDITQSRELDALLLAYACIVQQNRSISEVVILVQSAAVEFEGSGTLSQRTIDKIIENSLSVDPFSVIRNIAQFYSDNSIENGSLPPFYRYLNDYYKSDFVIGRPSVCDDSAHPEPSYEAVTCSYEILSVEDFSVESDNVAVSVEKVHIIGDMYEVNVNIPQNNESTPRETTILFKSLSTGKLLAQREFVQGVNMQIVELQIGQGTRATSAAINTFSGGDFGISDQIEVNGILYDLEIENTNRAIVKLPCESSYFFAYPAGSVAKADHVARVTVEFPAVVDKSIIVPYSAALEGYKDIPISNPASVKLEPVVALLGLRPREFGDVHYLVISGNGDDDYLSGRFTYVPNKENLYYFPELSDEVVRGSGREMRLTYQDDAGYFYAMLPPIELSSGLYVKLYDKDNQLIGAVTLPNGLTLKVSTITQISFSK